jgi:hypothetical protein
LQGAQFLLKIRASGNIVSSAGNCSANEKSLAPPYHFDARRLFMSDTQSYTESLLDIVKGIRIQTIMLPEFQRDFRWELEQTYDLFDSLIRDIFIGTIIYGKPAFALTLREVDQRPRRGKGSNAALKTYNYSASDITRETQVNNLRVVLDGQQRLTSIYRAVVGLDSVFFILKDDLDNDSIKDLSLEEMVERVAGDESPTEICVKLSDAYDAELEGLDDSDLDARFALSRFARRNFPDLEEIQQKATQKVYRRALRKIIDLYKQQKMVSYYLLDMSLEKFCVFFERSNSRGIQLNFTDILAAKLYRGFNLRKKIEEFESQSKLKLNREIIVRAIAYICGVERGDTISINRKSILENLEASDFQAHWDSVCSLYTESLNYLTSQNFILSQDWMPFENMIIPLMMFRRQIKGFDQINEEQRAFLEYWYWASIFANRYSMASNEVITMDSTALIQVAKGEQITARAYFTRLRSLVTEPDDLYSYTKKSSAIYRGILNLFGYAAKGLRDWNSTQKIDVTMRLEDHHIYPRAFIASAPSLDVEQSEAEQLVDCVVNRTLIPKLLNIQVGKKAPQLYLSELQQKVNPQLGTCLDGHLMEEEMVNDPTWNECFKLFLEERSKKIFELILRYAISPASEMSGRYGVQSEDSEDTDLNSKERLKDMLADGRIKVGELVFVRKQPNRFARILDGETVEYEGEKLPINSWGQLMTGWRAISIYDAVILERTRQPLKSLRRESNAEPTPQ